MVSNASGQFISKPPTAILVAMTRDRLIGAGNRLPWDIPEDRRLFRELTLGNTLIMGRKTFESIGTPLPGRTTIVLSRQSFCPEGVITRHSILEGLAAALRIGRPIFFVGGVDVYRKALPIADWLHVSWIERSYAGDRFFPPFDLSMWQAVEHRHFPDFEYVHYRRRSPQE